MNRKEKLEKLRALQIDIDEIRRELKIGQPGEVLYLVELAYSNNELIVVSDGFGGATASVVSGNYPIDFFALYQKHFDRENTALRTAEKIGTGGESPAEVLG